MRHDNAATKMKTFQPTHITLENAAFQMKT